MSEPDYITAYNLRTDPAIYYRRAVDEFLGYSRNTAYAISGVTHEGRQLPACRNIHVGYITRTANAMMESGRFKRVDVYLDLCG